jgi:thiamine biosynthesis protein ThiI
VQVLLSGGIDSPVAAWMAMKRGCRVEGVYFHSFPLIGDAAREKVIDLAGVLAAWACAPIKVRVVPFAEAQKSVRDRCDPRLYVLLYRRLMFRIAERIARKTRAKALVTGESLGQVASQTLDNLDVISTVTDMPVLRPLICMDKQETVDRAQAIGTFDISALPHEDCCSLFVPKHPETRGKRSDLERAEQALDIDGIVEAALAGVEVEQARPALL